jgi:hypothetical protein
MTIFDNYCFILQKIKSVKVFYLLLGELFSFEIMPQLKKDVSDFGKEHFKLWFSKFSCLCNLSVRSLLAGQHRSRAAGCRKSNENEM